MHVCAHDCVVHAAVCPCAFPWDGAGDGVLTPRLATGLGLAASALVPQRTLEDALSRSALPPRSSVSFPFRSLGLARAVCSEHRARLLWFCRTPDTAPFELTSIFMMNCVFLLPSFPSLPAEMPSPGAPGLPATQASLCAELRQTGESRRAWFTLQITPGTPDMPTAAVAFTGLEP